jgi:hypothetical protein
MKYFFLLLLLSAGCYQQTSVHTTITETDTTTSASSTNNNHVVEPEQWDTIECGDLNTDGIADTAFIYTPPTVKQVDVNGTLESYFGCDTVCFNRITFSCNLPEIIFNTSVWGQIENIGDLNSDGIHELIFCPLWFHSCRGQLYVYSLKNNKWEIVAQVAANRCEDTPLKDHIIKIKKNYFLAGEKFEDGDIVKYNMDINL